jgi:hypothetical protein
MRAHGKCWRGDRYQHVCARPSGHACAERPCGEPAGTDWSPYFCPAHDVERLDRVSAGFEEISRILSPGG